MLFHILLKEAIEEKQFETVEDFVKMIKSILRKASFPRYKEKKSKSVKGFAAPSQYGYKYKYLNGDITISFFGAERAWISELARALSTEKVNFHFNEKQDIFLIKAEDNVVPTELMTGSALEELEHNHFGVVGTTVDSRSEIKDAINSFNTTQREIYNELVHNGMVEWKMTKTRLGKVVKFKYRLVPVKQEI